MGAVKGRHDMPVDDYILTDVANPSDMNAINKAVFDRLAKVFEPYMVRGTVNVPNALEYVDVPAYVSTAELHLYVTGLTSVVLAAFSFCKNNNIPFIAWHYDRDTGEYVKQNV